MAVEHGKDCYRISRSFPKSEMFALTDQLKRAAVSISNNVAEGSVGSKANFIKYIMIAIGSTLETVNILNFAAEIGYIDQNFKLEMYEKAEKLIRKLRSFQNSLND